MNKITSKDPKYALERILKDVHNPKVPIVLHIVDESHNQLLQTYGGNQENVEHSKDAS